MPPSSDHMELQEFLASYIELHERFKENENARAMLNETAAELLSLLRRDSRDASRGDARRYFLWLLSKKGFTSGSYVWRDVDLPLHQCGYRLVVNVSFDEMNFSDSRMFSVDPRMEVFNGILVAQAVEHLNDEDRLMLTLRVLEGHTLREIGTKVGITPQGVKKRLDRICADVRKNMAERDEKTG